MKMIFTKVSHNYRPLDERPFPDYETFGMKDMLDNYSMATRVLYRYSRPYPRPFILVASRSCPFSCTFCTHGHDRPKYRTRSLDHIFQEIKERYELYHFNVLIILDELFAVNKERFKQFCTSILEGRQKYGWDFDWCFQTHANARLDLESLQLAKQAGCYNFSYGLESASPTVLKSMNKHIKPQQVAEAILLAEKAGLDFSANLIFGDPAETEQTIYESLDFFFRYCQKVCVFTSHIQPYPGSKIFDDAVRRGLINNKRLYYETIRESIFNLTKMPTEHFAHWFHVINWLEHNWAWVKTTTGYCQEETNYTDPILEYHKAKMYEIRATCPYCGKETFDRHIMQGIAPDGFIGRACRFCGRRVKMLLKEGNKKEGG